MYSYVNVYGEPGSTVMPLTIGWRPAISLSVSDTPEIAVMPVLVMVYVNVMDSPRETCEELALTETFKAASDAAAPMFNTVTVAVEPMGEPFSVHETSKLSA